MVQRRKRWKLLPPEHTHLLYDRFGREMAPGFELEDLGTSERFPNLALAAQHCITVVQVCFALSLQDRGVYLDTVG
jgi:hypothetical protein